MFGFMKSPINKVIKQVSGNTGTLGSSWSNPFDSDNELDTTPPKTLKPPRQISSEPTVITPNLNTNPFDDDHDVRRGGPSSSSSSNAALPSPKDKYKSDFLNSGGIENQSVQELEDKALYKAEETTKTVHGCLKIAEDIREDATRTLVMLNHQGEQITRTHTIAADIDKDLSRGEKLLGSLGGMFSKTWNPKKSRYVTGPLMTADNPSKRSENHLDQREKLGLTPVLKGRSANRASIPEPMNAIQKVELEQDKQDDALSDLSNILGDLKNMAVDMGTEIDRHNKALSHLGGDVDELNFRVKGANQRARRLLAK